MRRSTVAWSRMRAVERAEGAWRRARRGLAAFERRARVLAARLSGFAAERVTESGVALDLHVDRTLLVGEAVVMVSSIRRVKHTAG